MNIQVTEYGQLAGVMLIIPDPEFSWASRDQVIKAVMSVGAFVVEDLVYPDKTVLVLAEDRVGQAPDALAQTFLADDLWVMTDGWLKTLLAVGNRPGGNQSVHYGLEVVNGRLSKTMNRRRKELDLPRLLGNRMFSDASIHYQAIHNHSTLNF